MTSKKEEKKNVDVLLRPKVQQVSVLNYTIKILHILKICLVLF